MRSRIAFSSFVFTSAISIPFCVFASAFPPPEVPSFDTSPCDFRAASPPPLLLIIAKSSAAAVGSSLSASPGPKSFFAWGGVNNGDETEERERDAGHEDRPGTGDGLDRSMGDVVLPLPSSSSPSSSSSSRFVTSASWPYRSNLIGENRGEIKLIIGDCGEKESGKSKGGGEDLFEWAALGLEGDGTGGGVVGLWEGGRRRLRTSNDDMDEKPNKPEKLGADDVLWGGSGWRLGSGCDGGAISSISES